MYDCHVINPNPNPHPCHPLHSAKTLPSLTPRIFPPARSQLQNHQKIAQASLELSSFQSSDDCIVGALDRALRHVVDDGATEPLQRDTPRQLWDVLRFLRPLNPDVEAGAVERLRHATTSVWRPVLENALCGGVAPREARGLASVLHALISRAEAEGDESSAVRLSEDLQRVELGLLLARAGEVLAQQRGSVIAARFARWVLASERAGLIGDDQLVQQARVELEASGEGAADQGDRVQSPGAGVPGALTATQILEDGTQIAWARCPASLEPLVHSAERPLYQCCCCKRQYARCDPDAGCLLCAGSLGPSPGSLCFSAPCFTL